MATTLYASTWLRDGKPSGPHAICPDAAVCLAKLEEMNGRLIRLEKMMVELKTLLLERKP